MSRENHPASDLNQPVPPAAQYAHGAMLRLSDELQTLPINLSALQRTNIKILEHANLYHISIINAPLSSHNTYIQRLDPLIEPRLNTLSHQTTPTL
jgi:hypothetical protein